MRAWALDGVLCRLTVDGRPPIEALVSQSEQELVEDVDRVAIAAFHVCIDKMKRNLESIFMVITSQPTSRITKEADDTLNLFHLAYYKYTLQISPSDNLCI